MPDVAVRGCIGFPIDVLGAKEPTIMSLPTLNAKVPGSTPPAGIRFSDV